MTRQATDQLYIDLGYLTPEEYYTYIAEAESIQTATSTISCDASVIMGGEVVIAYGAMESFATMQVTLSNIYGADLFAFTNASLAIEVSVIRDNNIEVSNQFDLAADYIRIVQADSFETAAFTVDADFLRGRAFNIETQAAFSMTAEGETFRITEATAVISSQFSLGLILTNLGERPLQVKSNNLTVIDTAVKKFGTGSLKFPISNCNLEYYASKSLLPNTNGEFLLEFWIQPTQNPSDVIDFSITFNQWPSGLFPIWTTQWKLSLASNKIELFARGASSIYTLNAPTTVSLSQWSHIAVAVNTSGAAIFHNGSRVGYSSSFGIDWDQTKTSGRLILSNQSVFLGNVDEVRILTGSSGLLSTYGRVPTSTTISVPTQPFTNNKTDYRFLGHYDVDFSDDAASIMEAQATLISTTSASIQTSVIKSAQSDLLANGGLLVAYGIKTDQTADLYVTSELVCTAEFVAQEFSADLVAETALDAQVLRIQEFDLACNTTTDLTVLNDKIQQGTAYLVSNTEATINAVVITDVNVITSSTADLTAQVLRIQEGTAALLAESSALAVTSEGLLREAEALLFVDTALSVEPKRFSDAVITTQAIFSELTVVAKIADFFINCDVISTQVTDIVINAEANAELTSLTTTSAEANRTRDNSSNLFCDTAIIVSGTSNLDISAFISAQTEFYCDADESSDFYANLEVTTDLQAQVSRTRTIDSALSTTTSLVTSVEVTKGTTVSLETTTSLTATAGILADADADLVAFNTQLTLITVVHIDPYLTWVIEPEQRVYIIAREQREYIIEREVRTYIIRN